MKLPARVKATVKERLWVSADDIGWPAFDVHQRTRQYGIWMSDPLIGGVLKDYMDPEKARAYLKDTLMKPYARARLSAEGMLVLRTLSIAAGEAGTSTRFERPHGLLLPGNRVVCWGKADDWKLVLMAVHERAHALAAQPFSAVLLPPQTRFPDGGARAVVDSAARKLGIERLEWVESVPQLGRAREAGSPPLFAAPPRKTA
jgi:hypothetical protein